MTGARALQSRNRVSLNISWNRNTFLSEEQNQYAVADLRGGGTQGTPPGTKFSLISCSFREILIKLYPGAPPGVGAPSSGKFWIRHWYGHFKKQEYFSMRITKAFKYNKL